MSRYFALPVVATVLSLVGLRMLASPPAPAARPLELVVALPVEEPEARPAPPVPAEAPAPLPATPPPAPAPLVIVLDPLPAPAPVVTTEVLERIVTVPQQPTTVIYAPTTIYAPVVEAAPPPPPEAVETPVIIVTNPALGRPKPPCPPAARKDSAFKEIPFLPPTPRGPRWNP
jgi:hypothetical protein